MLNRTDYLNQKGDALVAAVVQSQQQKGLRDTGYSADNTFAQVRLGSSGFTLEIVGPAYWRFQERGRGPNRSGKPSRDMVQKMKAWAVRHGMPEEAGYPIAAKIAREGIAVPNAYNPGGVITDPLDATRIAQEVSSELAPIIKEEIKTTLFG
ncbi:hypothetical protein GCM10028807_32570 [Spirosoma daeguense]